MTAIPVVERDATSVFAQAGDRQITVAQFCADVQAMAAELPDADFVINLCQQRYTFTVCFFAALLRRQTTLLPSRRETQAALALRSEYADCTLIADEPAEGVDCVITLAPGSHGEASVPNCPGSHIAAIAFTSGSTGEPQAHEKSWRMLDTWRRVHRSYLPGEPSQALGLVSTVPSWHMYGLEWSLLLPTVAPLTLHCGADFYPQDVSAAITGFDLPCVLVSTPLHLRALTRQASLPSNVQTVLSATAPLDESLLHKVEQAFGADLFEIYGCSEIGSLACRYPARDSRWRFFDCFDVGFDAGEITINHRELPHPITLADRFSRQGTNEFELEGRSSDIIKVGGKRESLANLNGILLSIEGVQDAVIYEPATFGLADTGRLAALVVAPGRDSNAIRSAMAQQVDGTFIPRPIRLVHELPRDSTSKLKRADLARLITES